MITQGGHNLQNSEFFEKTLNFFHFLGFSEKTLIFFLENYKTLIFSVFLSFSSEKLLIFFYLCGFSCAPLTNLTCVSLLQID